jgi:hypothetical protein
MVQGYYTLDEAAHILGIATEELSHMAQRREVRAFADRGTWRFRTQDIEELARRRGQGSNPDLPLGEAPRPRPHDTPTARSSPEPTDQGVFPFGLGTDTEQIDLGASSGSPSGVKSGGKSSSKGPKSPTQKPGSDSDVRLVPDGSNVAFAVNKDSDIKLVDDSESASPSGKKKASGPKADSGVKLVPMDAGPQSPVRLTPHEDDDSAVLGGPPSRTSSDSDVRLEVPSDRPGRKSGAGRERGPEDSFLTEEIDLDAEMKKAGEASGPKKPQPRPASSPAFELSEADLAVPRGETPSSTEQTADSSSDFDISLPGTDEIEVGSKDKESQQRDEEEISLGDLPTSGVTGESGINLGRPTDSGISLEPEGVSSDEIELELRQRAASAGPATPPRPMEPAKEVADSSSDFELTLEDSGRLAPLDEERPAAAAKGDKGDKDIFETDFEVPALEDESGSQAMALDESDTDLESSDFDLALDEGDMAVEDESGSQVVALDDEDEVDEGAATVTRTRQRAAALSEEETGEYAGEELEEEVAPSRRAAAVAAAPASWGLFAPIVLLFSFFVLFLVGLMSFELVRGMWGYHQSTRVASPVVRVISGLFYDAKDLPTD